MPELSWKPDQTAALNERRDMVLTASAGTGKTTILVEKLSTELLAMAERYGDASVLNRIVGITFTDLAAAELKARVRSRLIERYERGELTQEQRRVLIAMIRNLDSAYIGTIHSFCRRILQENFIDVALSPGFAVLDEEAADELRRDSAMRALHRRAEADPLLLEFTAAHGLGKMADTIVSLSMRMRSDGIEEIDPEILYEGYRKAWVEKVEELVPRLESFLREMLDIVNRFNSAVGEGNPTEATESIGITLRTVIEAMKPVFDNPVELFRSELPETLLSKKSIPVARNKGLEKYNVLLEELRALVGIERKGTEYCLQHFACIEDAKPLYLSLLTMQAEYNRFYSFAKERIDALDFDDLLLRTRRLLSENSQVRARYHRQFQHIYVDEFQDVSEIQRGIVSLLRGFDEEEQGANRSLFIVGDGKQSIYRFRSADVLQFRAFADRLVESNGVNLQLRNNYRSHPRLIEGFNRIFDRLFEAEQRNRYQMEYQPIEAFREDIEPHTQRIEIIGMGKKDHRHEGMIIANRIRALLKEQEYGDSARRFKPGDIAILLRTFSNLTQYEIELGRAAIPYVVIAGKGFYQQREIWDIASYLKMIWFPQDEYALAAVLRSPLCLLSDDTLYELARSDVFRSGTIFDEATLKHIEGNEKERFERLRALALEHRKKRDAAGSAQMIEELLALTDYDAFLLANDGGDQRAANVRKLIELARKFEAEGVNSGPEFALDLDRRLYSDRNESQAVVSPQAEDAVKILTVHKSKGLQFPVVIIPHLHYGRRGDREPVIYERQQGLGFKSLGDEGTSGHGRAHFSRVSARIKTQEEAEHLRLLYVAMTRAKELVIMPALKDPGRKGSYLTSWHERLAAGGALDEDGAAELGIRLLGETDFKGRRKERQSLVERSNVLPPGPVSAGPLSPEIDELVQLAEGAVSQKILRHCGVWELINIVYPDLDDDEQFRELLQAHAEFELTDSAEQLLPDRSFAGSVVHSVLEGVNYGQPPQRDELVQSLRAHGLGETMIEEAAGSLDGWLSSPAAAEIAGGRARKEVPFTFELSSRDDRIYLNGIIDLLVELDGGDLWLLDYKYAESKESPPYELQLRLYAMAVEKAFGRLPVRAALIYLKDNRIQEVDIGPDAQEAARKIVFEKIRELISERNVNSLYG